MRILELFAGIGGIHVAMQNVEIPYEVVAAFEINPTVISVYKLNFPGTNIQTRNILSLTAEEINSLSIDMIVMSPPCQPFCRTGKKKDLKDTRSDPLSHIIKILPDVHFKYMFVENVFGFENSEARNALVSVLKKCGLVFQEFLLNPLDFGVPNSRLRYYLIAKHEQFTWSPASRRLGIQGIHTASQMKNEGILPHEAPLGEILSNYLDQEDLIPPELIVKDDSYKKFESVVDVVSPSSSRSCCFTKSYFHYVKGTGSILKIDQNGSCYYRYFTPREVLRIMCYPEKFKFPEHLTFKQCYKAVGNSVNVRIVTHLLNLLIS